MDWRSRTPRRVTRPCSDALAVRPLALLLFLGMGGKAFTRRLARGTYKWQVFATGTAGGAQSAQNTKKLIVK